MVVILSFTDSFKDVSLCVSIKAYLAFSVIFYRCSHILFQWFFEERVCMYFYRQRIRQSFYSTSLISTHRIRTPKVKRYNCSHAFLKDQLINRYAARSRKPNIYCPSLCPSDYLAKWPYVQMSCWSSSQRGFYLHLKKRSFPYSS